MRHRKHRRKLGMVSSHRDAMLRNMVTSLFRHERIRTTVPRAKLLKPFAEKLITMARRETLHARRMVYREIKDHEVVGKLFDILAARYAERPGGYTRILKLGHRPGDAADMCYIELVDRAIPKKEEETTEKAPEKKGLLGRFLGKKEPQKVESTQ